MNEVLSVHVVPALKLNDKEVGFVKQLKELQSEHSGLQRCYENLQESKQRAVEQLITSREVNREASQVIAVLEEKIKILGQDKLGLELQQFSWRKRWKLSRGNAGTVPAHRLLSQPLRSGFYAEAKQSLSSRWTPLSLPLLLPHLKSLGTRRKDGTSRHPARKGKCLVPRALLTT
jgi:hypothetical protein